MAGKGSFQGWNEQNRTFLWQGFLLRPRQIQTRKSPKAGLPKAALLQHTGAGMRLQSLNRRETWRVSRHLLKSSQTPVSAHRGVKVSVLQWEIPAKGRRKNFCPKMGIETHRQLSSQHHAVRTLIMLDTFGRSNRRKLLLRNLVCDLRVVVAVVLGIKKDMG